MSGSSDKYLFSIEKLNGDNYQLWQHKVKMLLKKDKVWEAISDETSPSSGEAGHKEWKDKDDYALSTITMSVDDNQLIHILEAETAKDAWKTLADLNQKSSLSRKVYLRKKLFKLSLSERGNMEEHITEFLSLKNQLAAVGKKFDDDDLAAMLLSSLPDSYGTLVTTLENRPETEITLDFVKGKLIEEYRRRKDRKDAENFESEEEGVEMAMKADVRFSRSAVECF